MYQIQMHMDFAVLVLVGRATRKAIRSMNVDNLDKRFTIPWKPEEERHLSLVVNELALGFMEV